MYAKWKRHLLIEQHRGALQVATMVEFGYVVAAAIFIWLCTNLSNLRMQREDHFQSDHKLQALGRAKSAVNTQSSFQFFCYTSIKSKNIQCPIPTTTMPNPLLSAFSSAIILHSLSVSTNSLVCIQRYCTAFYTLKDYVYILRRSIERGLTQPGLKGERKTYENAVSKRRKLFP